MADCGARSALLTLLCLFGVTACTSPPPRLPPQVVVDTQSPLVSIEPTPAQVVPTPSHVAPLDVEAAEAPRPTASRATASRPTTETDPFRSDSLDGNRTGRELVEQILRMPNDKPSESGVTEASPEK